MCKKNLKKQNVVEELSLGGGGGGDFKRPTQREMGEKGWGGGGERLSEEALKRPTQREKKKEKEKKESYEVL